MIVIIFILDRISMIKAEVAIVLVLVSVIKYILSDMAVLILIFNMLIMMSSITRSWIVIFLNLVVMSMIIVMLGNVSCHVQNDEQDRNLSVGLHEGARDNDLLLRSLPNLRQVR